MVAVVAARLACFFQGCDDEEILSQLAAPDNQGHGRPCVNVRPSSQWAGQTKGWWRDWDCSVVWSYTMFPLCLPCVFPTLGPRESV